MNVVATGVIVTRQPEGFSIVAWHRHDRPLEGECENDVYTHLVEDELMQVLAAHFASYLPGDVCVARTPWIQQRFF